MGSDWKLIIVIGVIVFVIMAVGKIMSMHYKERKKHKIWWEKRDN